MTDRHVPQEDTLGPLPTGARPDGQSTKSNGAPAVSDRNSLTVGPNGPLLLHDVHLVETLAHFNRANVPERRPHAKGSGAFGVFETTEDVSQYTRAALFQKGAKTKMLARFSTVAGEMGSPDTWRDVRGFALKFYTSEGNYDLVGNNTPIFFVRDPMKFSSFIASQKRLPGNGLRDNNMQWDFWSMNPESAHQVTYLMGDRGLPKTYRHMNGYGSHTYMWTNAAGERFWVKYHFHSQQGVEGLTGDQATKIAGEDADFHRRDLWDAIERGEFPQWKLSVQVMPYEEAKTYRYNPFDLTKTWSHKDYPLIEVGTMTLNANPANFFAQIEQAAFSPSNLVPGIGFSPDKMLLGRVFAYPDQQRHRIGTNYDQLPVNRPVVERNFVGMLDGNMNYEQSEMAEQGRIQAVYAPNSMGRSYSDEVGPVEDGWESDGEMVRQAYTLREDDDDFGQPGILVREVWNDEQRETFVNNVAGHLLGGVKGDVLQRAFAYWKAVDQTTGERIQAKVEAGTGEPNPYTEHEAADARAASDQTIEEHHTNAAK